MSSVLMDDWRGFIEQATKAIQSLELAPPTDSL